MPEMHFHVRWPDGSTDACYSPSLVIKDYFEVGESYPLADFLTRSETALQVASDRVKARFGHACSRAQSQVLRIHRTAEPFKSVPDAHVFIINFTD